MSLGFNDPRWAQLYPPRLANASPQAVPPTNPPDFAHYDPSVIGPAAPHWTDILVAEAQANPMANTLQVNPGISLPAPLPTNNELI